PTAPPLVAPGIPASNCATSEPPCGHSPPAPARRASLAASAACVRDDLAHRHEPVAPEQVLELADDGVQVDVRDERVHRIEAQPPPLGRRLARVEVERERAVIENAVERPDEHPERQRAQVEATSDRQAQTAELADRDRELDQR